MELVRQVIVFDAAELGPESAFWAAVLDGRVVAEPDWHSVLDAAGRWQIGVQLVPDHRPPTWPTAGVGQQVHLDLHVEDGRAACASAEALGARLLQSGDLDAAEGHQVFADPAGHPFCIGWGHPSDERIARYIADR